MSNYVLVHGAFVSGSYWRDVAVLLEKEGHRVDVVGQLPSAGRDPAALGDLQADTDLVRQTVESGGESVVLVGHSYGGMVLTELANHPAVAHAVYVAAFWPTRGQSVMEILGGGPPPDWLIVRDDGTLAFTDDLEVRRQIECGDVDAERAAETLRNMVPQSLSSFAAPSTAPERDHPTTYIICEHDQAIPPAAQEQWAANADNVVRLPSSHQAMVSMPDRLAAVLTQVRPSQP
jgi:pimeloyl-ACP methyl ester carboxylesterase